jgi:hypothetical protein
MKSGIPALTHRKPNKKNVEAGGPPMVGAFDEDERAGQGLPLGGRTIPKRWNMVGV